MEHEKLSYPEALRWLAGKYGIEIEERKLTPEELEEQTERESLSNLSAWAQKWYSEQLLETGEGKSVGLGYFRSRGFTDETIEGFALGYCPERPWSEEGALAGPLERLDTRTSGLWPVACARSARTEHSMTFIVGV